MASTDAVSRLAPYVEQLLEDEAARDNLRQGAGKLRGAYQRSQEKRVKGAKDTQKPKKRRGKTLLALLTLGAIGAGVAIALNEDLRSSLLGSSPNAGQSTDGAGS